MSAVASRVDPPSPCRPGLRHGPTPERGERDAPGGPNALDRFAARALRAFGARWRGRRAAARARAVARRAAALGGLPETERCALFERLRASLRRRGHDERSVIEALGHAVLLAERTLGLHARDGQRIAAEALLRGHFVEMPTGEGKTLAVALAAAAAALDGTPVHVLTANDYLAERDARRLAPLYAALGLSSAWVSPEMDERERRAAYAADVVHLTGKQIGFDRMRDALAADAQTGSLAARLGELARPCARGDERHEPLLRGLCSAIVDEADSLLIDEARTPLVLAAPRAERGRAERESVVALGLARMLDAGVDYRLSRKHRAAELTEHGAKTLGELAERVAGTWRSARYRDERVRDALAALHLWHRDRDYVVRDDAVELVDEHSGRTLPDRRLQRGMHMLLEIKEHCAPKPENEIVASIACQRLFRRYRRLAGTSGTLQEVRGELEAVYGACLVRVPHARSPRRETLPARVLPSRARQLDALMEEVRRCRAAERPVLIGTRSVEQSNGVAALLVAHGVAHRVLNASQDTDEAAIVAEAGQLGRVTVATNMAGRGTDIPLGAGVAERGGLHVVSLAFNDARRIDRQLAGRAARQGDPGSFRQLWSLADARLCEVVPVPCSSLARHLLHGERCNPLVGALAVALVRLAQRRLEWRHARERRAALAADKAWVKWSEERQTSTLAALDAIDATYTDREAFVAALKPHVGKLKAPELKLLQKHLGEHDEAAAYCLSKGEREPNLDLRDTENVPLGEDIDAYFEREVTPHVPDAWIDRSKVDERDGQVGIVGYEIPFNRHFYVYVPPRPLEEIDADLARVSKEIVELLGEVGV